MPPPLPETEQRYSLLNVSSASDLTARARIRDAAIDLFGRHGFAHTRVRDIAEQAGVSPGLVLHHFGSKVGLRHACDALVTDELFARKDALTSPSAAEAIRSWLADVEAFRPLLRYISRMLTDGSQAGADLFAAFLDGTRRMIDEQIDAGIMRDVADREVIGAYLTVFGLAPLLLQEHLAAAFGEREMSAALSRRATLPILDLYTHGLYTDDRFLRMAEEALTDGRPAGRSVGPRSDKGEGDPNQDPDPPAPRAP